MSDKQPAEVKRSTIDELMVVIGDVPMVFGLKAQGHLDTVTEMLKQRKSWDEIGTAIGWHGPAVAEFYALTFEAERLRADKLEEALRWIYAD